MERGTLNTPNEHHRPLTSTSDETINLLDYLEAIITRKRMVLGITLAAAILSVVVSLLLPKIYSATARILPPPQDQSLTAALMGQMTGGLASLSGGLLGAGTSSDLYVGMFESEDIKDAIIDRFQLMDVYEAEYRVDTYEALAERVSIKAGKKDGIITITVEDEDPNRAAAMANALVEELDKLTIGLSVSGAGRNKAFLEQRLVEARTDLAQAEDALESFQTRHKTIDVSEQTKASIVGVAELMSQLSAQELQLATMQRAFTDSSQEVKTLRTSITNLRSQIGQIEGVGPRSAIPSVGSIPALGQEYVRLIREFKIKETIVELLTQQYELSRLSEAKTVSQFQIVQRARPPDKKERPKRTLIVLMATFSAFVFSVLLCIALEAASNCPPEISSRVKALFIAHIKPRLDSKHPK